VPRVEHPDWLLKRVAAASDTRKQTRISSMFSKQAPKRPALDASIATAKPGGERDGSDVDMEDLGVLRDSNAAARLHATKRRKLARLHQVRSCIDG
jgi:hypothetical protein